MCPSFSFCKLEIDNYKFAVSAIFGPIVYRLGHKLFKLGSRVRLPVGSQIETWSEVSAKSGRAEGALYGEGMKSVLRARANSEGGRKARNEILIVSFFESKNYL